MSLYMGHADTVDDNGIYMRLDPWRTDNPIDAGIKCKDIFMPNGIPIQPRPVNLNFSIYN